MTLAIFALAPALAIANPLSFAVVYPTGVFPDDVQNVQAALDKGGTVFLRAVNKSGVPTAFNFGSPEPLPGRWVYLRNDVNLIGESLGPWHTTINGGFGPIFGKVPVRTSIIGIDFEGPLDDAIDLIATAGTEIVGNHVSGVVPLQVQVASGRIITVADGIDLSSFGSPQNSTGKVQVAGNKIENLLSDFSNGIQVDSTDAEVSILGNAISNVSSNGMVVIRANKSVLIAGNTVVTQEPYANAGMLIDGNRGSGYKVVDNTVVCDGIFADGIQVSGGSPSTDGTLNAFIANNHVTMHTSQFGGISLYDLVTDSLVQNNKIDGDAAYALQVSTFGFLPETASLNRFIDNDISKFASSVADVFLDANSQNNAVIGQCRTVIDLGAGNVVTCNQSAFAPLTSQSSAPASSNMLAASSPGPITLITPQERKRQAVQLVKAGVHASTAAK